MCGITVVIHPKCKDPKTYLANTQQRTVDMSDKIKHRGPDWSGIYQTYATDYAGETIACSMAHQRLSIVGVFSGGQPIVNGSTSLCVNGEIYSHEAIKEQYKSIYEYQTDSDCEAIQALYCALYHESSSPSTIQELFKKLDGQFAFVLFDYRDNQSTFLVGRDPIGICPLYYGYTMDGEICFASELKAIQDQCIKVQEFPPGHYGYYLGDGKFDIVKYYKPEWQTAPFRQLGDPTVEYRALNTVLTKAVEKRLMSDVAYGVLLSGGLDSALISSIAVKILKEKQPGKELSSFSIGLKGSPDLAAAEKVAKHIGTKHYGFEFTFQDGLNAIKDVIKHLETYDVTTIRASTPMFLLSRKIKAMGVKMVLSGEGADEVLGGYLHFHKAPSPEAFHDECKMRVDNLHNFDCLRANKSTMAWGLEARVPFLDKEVLEQAMLIHPELKCHAKDDGLKTEKYVLRKAFEEDYLPNEILWRQKEQFSDGVGYSWIDGLKAHAEAIITDDQMKLADDLYPYNTPQTKEAMWYRHIFTDMYSKAQAEKTVSRWVPQTSWEGVSSDPSGRAQQVHDGHGEWD
jgi:asparagine synthase (glutamine-hydrolysing)